MGRLFWFTAGVALGAAGYRYFEQQGGQIPAFESLGDQGRRLRESGQQLADATQLFADSVRQMADQTRQLAQIAMGAAQSKGQEMMGRVQDRAGMSGWDPNQAAGHPVREQVKDDLSSGPSGG